MESNSTGLSKSGQVIGLHSNNAKKIVWFTDRRCLIWRKGGNREWGTGIELGLISCEILAPRRCLGYCVEEGCFVLFGGAIPRL